MKEYSILDCFPHILGCVLWLKETSVNLTDKVLAENYQFLFLTVCIPNLLKPFDSFVKGTGEYLSCVTLYCPCYM